MQPVQHNAHTAAEQLLGELIDLVARCQHDMTELNSEEVIANCLSAMTSVAGGGLSLLLTPDSSNRLRLELASDSLPFPAEALKLNLSEIDPAVPGRLSNWAERVATRVQTAVTGQSPNRDVFVQALGEVEPLGGVLVHLANRQRTFDPPTRERMQQLAGVIHQLLRATRQFRHLLLKAAIDPVTGLFNQRYFESRLRAELARASRHGHPLGLLFFDLDDFGACSDAIGIDGANGLLHQVADLLRSTDEVPGARFSFRRSDVAVRHSGEEFVVLLPETPKWGVLTKAERLRKAIESLPRPGPNGSGTARLTASIGVAAFPEDASDATSLIEAAMRAMVRAKEAGKNRVEPA